MVTMARAVPLTVWHMTIARGTTRVISAREGRSAGPTGSEHTVCFTANHTMTTPKDITPVMQARVSRCVVMVGMATAVKFIV